MHPNPPCDTAHQSSLSSTKAPCPPRAAQNKRYVVGCIYIVAAAVIIVVVVVVAVIVDDAAVTAAAVAIVVVVAATLWRRQ